MIQVPAGGRVFSGIQPTERPHLGNYLGAIRNWVALQDRSGQGRWEAIYCIVDLHALTVPQDPAKLAGRTREGAAALMAAGIDPAVSVIFNQSRVAGHSELSWLLGCITPLGWLNRMTQFKEKAGSQREQAGLGLYSYPVLMSADVLLYRATHVPVGEDQRQHLELARDIAAAFNRQFGEDFFPLPVSQVLGDATRVMSLRDGSRKMSKSDPSDYSRINLADDAATIARKLRKAKTDSGPLPSEPGGLAARPEARNLVALHASLTGQDVAQVLRDHAGQSFSAFKDALTAVMVEVLAPINDEMRRLLADPGHVDGVLNAGAGRAASLAAPVLARVRQLMGLHSG